MNRQERDELILGHINLARSAAYKFARINFGELDADDLTGDAFLALVKFADRFRKEKGFKFSTFIYRQIWYWLLNARYDYLLVRVPRHNRYRAEHQEEITEITRVSQWPTALDRWIALSSILSRCTLSDTQRKFLVNLLQDKIPAEIARHMGISKARAGQLEKIVMAKLRMAAKRRRPTD